MDNVQYLKNVLITEGKSRILQWLQKVLLECCYVKLSIDYGKLEPPSCCSEEQTYKIRVMESIPYHCILRKKSIPLVPWNLEQSNAMIYKPFVMLLHKLGFHLPEDAGSIFARIPEFWTADIMYNVAQKLGTIDKSMLKFDVNLLHNIDQEQYETDIKDEAIKLTDLDKGSQNFSVSSVNHSNSIIRFTPDPNATPSVPNWLQLVMKSKCNVSLGHNTNNNNATSNNNNTNSNNNNSNVNNIGPSKVLEAIAEIENHENIIPEEDEKRENNDKEDNNIIEEDIKEIPAEELIDDDEYLEEKYKHLIKRTKNNRCGITTTETVNALNIAVSKALNQLKTENSSSSFIIPIKKSRNPLLRKQSSEDDSLMKSLDESHDDSSGYQTRRGSQMDTEFNSIVTSVIDTEFLNNVSSAETDSISSDLTRMYVSDEEHIPNIYET